ncbi:hypothetical protein [Gaoshiqia sediminis]|uniref:Uncharacterized protein n=1 Tax=Gaoshiqia sediminis TaxID=2986998 RepID=A0AA42C592_9BACT|nr:hypothetical protein [Gaoshiqia sediminis]MCW0482568.1 hypothetical protein [Gaoshiqia sediminis]
MEDYIFILLAIVLSIIGAYNQSKKKKAAEQMMDEEDTIAPRPSVFEQLFDDDFFTDEKPIVKPVVKPFSKPEPPKPMGYQPLIREEIRKKPVKPVKKTPAQVIETTLAGSQAKNNPIRKDFSLKKAVIYSEILQRKY